MTAQMRILSAFGMIPPKGGRDGLRNSKTHSRWWTNLCKHLVLGLTLPTPFFRLKDSVHLQVPTLWQTAFM
ncbi:hypothetical protein SBA1_140070 [Candidatus Sulfotelmatobacter kueseliae]|uniref:Uncharacterized protein n=1 Tax=Candidatus Sulfotelmatobacter kueseliae TaxID=2042962 RepID=A0A2U3K6B2_9BACT|nr:hypothetical protein SBA1_140070 [Candidatus Sulfotelmatobacter kueseliae]